MADDRIVIRCTSCRKIMIAAILRLSYEWDVPGEIHDRFENFLNKHKRCDQTSNGAPHLGAYGGRFELLHENAESHNWTYTDLDPDFGSTPETRTFWLGKADGD